MAVHHQSRNMPWIPDSLLPAKTTTLNSWRHSHTAASKLSAGTHQPSQISNGTTDPEESNASKTLRELTRVHHVQGSLKPVVPTHYVRDGLIILNHSGQNATPDKSLGASEPAKETTETAADQQLLLETLQFFESKRKKTAGSALENHRKQLSMEILNNSSNSVMVSTPKNRDSNLPPTPTSTLQVKITGAVTQPVTNNFISNSLQSVAAPTVGLSSHRTAKGVSVEGLQEVLVHNEASIKEILARMERLEQCNQANKENFSSLNRENLVLQEKLNSLKMEISMSQKKIAGIGVSQYTSSATHLGSEIKYKGSQLSGTSASVTGVHLGQNSSQLTSSGSHYQPTSGSNQQGVLNSTSRPRSRDMTDPATNYTSGVLGHSSSRPTGMAGVSGSRRVPSLGGNQHTAGSSTQHTGLVLSHTSTLLGGHHRKETDGLLGFKESLAKIKNEAKRGAVSFSGYEKKVYGR